MESAPTSRRYSRTFASTLAIASLFVASANSSLGKERQESSVTVWADATFDKTGALESLEFSAFASQPASFLDRLRVPLSRMKIKPVMFNGEPAVFRTGLRVNAVVSTSAESARFSISSISVQPLPLQAFKPDFESLGLRGYDEVRFEVTALCRVTVSGSCTEVRVRNDAGAAPERFLRAVREAYGKWTFQPQRVNGEAVEGEATMGFALVIE